MGKGVGGKKGENKDYFETAEGGGVIGRRKRRESEGGSSKILGGPTNDKTYNALDSWPLPSLSWIDNMEYKIVQWLVHVHSIDNLLTL